MRLLTLSVVLLACSPLRVFGGEAVTEEEAAAQWYKKAEEDLKAAQARLELTKAKIQGETIERQEDPKAGEPPQGNLRGTNGIARSSSAVTNPVVVDEEEAELAQAQAKEKLAENKFEEAVGEMAKFFEFHELRAAGMRQASNDMDVRK